MRSVIKKIIIGITAVIFLISAYFYTQFSASSNPSFGITFSPYKASAFGLDWKTVYLDALNDLKPKKMRVVADRELLMPRPGHYDYHIFDEILIEAGKQNVAVTMALPVDCNRESVAAVEHFKQFSAIERWELNAECDVAEELQAIKERDNKPVVLSYHQKKVRSQISAVQIKRVSYSKLFGHYQNPFPPLWYQIKAGKINTTIRPELIIGTYIQGSPETKDGILKTDIETQKAIMNPLMFQENIEFARKVGLPEYYLEGMEWWYWLSHTQNDWGMWEAARTNIK